MALFMFSLTGIPPFAGFFGKYYVFAGAVEAGYTWLAIVGVLMSVVSAYYYLRLVVVMYFQEGAGRPTGEATRLGLASLVLPAIASARPRSSSVDDCEPDGPVLLIPAARSVRWTQPGASMQLLTTPNEMRTFDGLAVTRFGIPGGSTDGECRTRSGRPDRGRCPAV